MTTYKLYDVPNGRTNDFRKGYTGAGYPGACKLIGEYETVADVRTLIDELHRGVWPVNAVLRWNTRKDITIESGLIPNEYAHEIENIKNDGAFGFDFETQMTVEEIEEALDFICSNYDDGVSATVEEA